MYERFTDRARRVTVLAQEEARFLGANHIGTEHILLGLIHEGEGIAAQALALDLGETRNQVEKLVGTSAASPTGHLPFTPRAKKVMELALREALQFGHNYVGTEHLLLGIIREGEGIAAQVLGLTDDLAQVRRRVVFLLAGVTATPGLRLPDKIIYGDVRPAATPLPGTAEEEVANRVTKLEGDLKGLHADAEHYRQTVVSIEAEVARIQDLLNGYRRLLAAPTEEPSA